MMIEQQTRWAVWFDAIERTEQLFSSNNQPAADVPRGVVLWDIEKRYQNHVLYIVLATRAQAEALRGLSGVWHVETADEIIFSNGAFSQ